MPFESPKIRKKINENPVEKENQNPQITKKNNGKLTWKLKFTTCLTLGGVKNH